MEELSFIDESLKESIKKQMKKAINKRIIPEAVVIFDGDIKFKYTVMNLFIGNEEKVHAKLTNELGLMSFLY